MKLATSVSLVVKTMFPPEQPSVIESLKTINPELHSNDCEGVLVTVLVGVILGVRVILGVLVFVGVMLGVVVLVGVTLGV